MVNETKLLIVSVDIPVTNNDYFLVVDMLHIFIVMGNIYHSTPLSTIHVGNGISNTFGNYFDAGINIKYSSYLDIHRF